MKYIDDFLDNITMYRLVAYGLTLLYLVALAISVTGRFGFGPVDLLVSTAIILTVRFVTDQILLRLFKVPGNLESGLITGLILALILQPMTSWDQWPMLALAGFVASASKFVLAWRGKHIFNPAASSAAALSLFGLYPVTWWVSNSAMWPLTLLLGLAIVRKVKRFPMVLTFVIAAVLLQVLLLALRNRPIGANIEFLLISSPLIFLATIMLTEPSTSPPRKYQQLVYAGIVAIMYAAALKLGPLRIYPETALLIGNIYAFAVSARYRLRLRLKEIQQISDRVYNYVFEPDKPLRFLAGQYMEWTLAEVPYDSRGNRRTFTIASSPTEDTVQLGMKFYEPSSAYKRRMRQLKPGAVVHAGQIMGDFTLEGTAGRKLAFIAGGIGITPFRSMAKYLMDTNAKADIVLLYVVSDEAELAYRTEFERAAAIGLKLVPIVTRAAAGKKTVFGPEVIKQHIPDFAERIFYVSGPRSMVESSDRYLRGMGVRRGNIRTDHFSGY